MTLLARRREELSRGPEEAAALEERRSVVVRPHPIQRSFLHLQEAIGNGGAARLLGALAGSGAPAARAHRAPPARVLVAQHLRPAIGRAWEDRRQRPRLIVPDGAEPGPGQIARAAFISTIAEAARQAAEEGLVEIGQTARDCPLIEHYTRLYTQRSAARLEADVLRYVPAARLARSAEDYIAAASAHVRASVLEWIRTGDLVGLPRGLPGSELAAAIHRTGTSNPAAVRTRLGEGRPLGGAARSRMERAFRTNLGEVRIHTDEAAAREAHAQNARAFAVGSHIAFGRDEYRPGSIVGDALLAHEVAHTLQQRGVDSPAAQSRTGSQRLERDAHVAAGGALASLWAGATALGSAMARMAFPRLRSGLALARCAGERFTDEELKTYLDHIREHGPEGKLSSDNKARAVVREFRGGSGKFPLDDWLVLNLIKEMLGGAVLADDEAQIFELLRRSENDRLEYLFTKDRLTPKMVLQDIGGQSEADIKKFFELRFVGGMEAVEGDEVEARGKPYPDLERLADRQLESIRAEAKRKKVERLEEERKRRERERRKKEKEGDEESVTDDPPLPSSADVKVDTGDMVDALALKAKKEEKKKEPIDKWLEEEEKDGGVSYLAFATETIERVENAAKKSKKFEEIAEMMELAPPKFDASIAKDALQNKWFAAISGGTEFQVSMSWIEAADDNPRSVFGNIAHEVGGHIYLRKRGSLSRDLSKKVLAAIPAEDRKELFDTAEKRQAFADAFTYPETEIFAELRERKYFELGLGKGGDAPDQNIPELLQKLKQNWDAELARAILTNVVDLARVTKGIRESDVDFLIAAIDRADMGFEIR